jgi:hypothetical protein
MSLINPPVAVLARTCGAVLISAAVMACSSEPPGPFDVAIGDYERMSDLPEDTSAGPSVEGRVVVVNVGESLSHHYRTAFTQDDDIEVQAGTVSAIQGKIAVTLRANTPQEVGTVILLRWAKEVLGRNIAGVEFVRVRCEVVVVDRTTQRVVGRREFVGTRPEGTHRWGSSPEAPIVTFINGLPRRSSAQPAEESAPTASAPSVPTKQAAAGGSAGGPARRAYPLLVRSRFLDGCTQNSPRAFCECGIARFEEIMALDEFERQEAAVSAGSTPSAGFMAVISYCRTKVP